MTATIDLGERKKFSRISMDVFDDEPAWIYAPTKIEIFSSDDGINFSLLKSLAAAEIKNAHEVISLDLGEQHARFVKVKALNAGKIPDGKQGAGNNSWLFADEISIE